MVFAAVGAHGAALAGTTTTVTYDALGRLTNSSTTGTINNGLQSQLSYDAADNRTSYQVTAPLLLRGPAANTAKQTKSRKIRR